MQEYDILKVKNALVKSVYYATEYTICFVVRITTVHTAWTNEMQRPSLLLRMCMYCPVQFVFTVFDENSQAQPLHSSGKVSDSSSGGDRVVVFQPGHLLSRVTFVAGFRGHDGKYGRVLYTRQRSLRFEFFPIHYHPIIRQGVTLTFMGRSGVTIWDREHDVVGNVSFTQKLRPLGTPKVSYLWDSCWNRKSCNSDSGCKPRRTVRDLHGVRQNMIRRHNACSEFGVFNFEQILWIN